MCQGTFGRLLCEMLFTKELSPSLSNQADPIHVKLLVLTSTIILDTSFGSIQLSIFLFNISIISANNDRILLSISIAAFVVVTNAVVVVLPDSLPILLLNTHFPFLSCRRIIFTMEQWKVELVLFQWVAPKTRVTRWAICNRALFMCLKCHWVWQVNTVKLSTRELNQVSPKLRVCRSLGFLTYSSMKECYSLTNYLRIMRPSKGWKRQPATWPWNLAKLFSERIDNRCFQKEKILTAEINFF